AVQALHVLGLAGRDVGEVDATQHAGGGDGAVGLSQVEGVSDGVRERARLERLQEGSPGVTELLRGDLERTGHGQLAVPHHRSSWVGVRPPDSGGRGTLGSYVWKRVAVHAGRG